MVGGAEGQPAPAWALVVGREDLDVEAMAVAFGVLYRVALDPRTDAAAIEPGHRCVLFRTDRSRTVGVWAIGEVVAPVLELSAGDPLLPGEAPFRPAEGEPRRYAEVELALLEKPLSVDRLRGDPVLAASTLLREEPTQLVALAPEELRAIEALDFWLIEPDDDQRHRFDQLLAEEDDLLP